MRIIHNWNNGKKEIFRGIPVACPMCESEVSVSGSLEEGELRLDDCPSCGEEFSLVVIDAALDDEPPPIEFLAKATVIWFLNGGAIPQASATIGPTTNVADLLLTVLNNAIQFYAPTNQTLLRATMARLILEETLTKDDARAVMGIVEGTLSARPTIVDTTSGSQEATGQKTNNPVLNLKDTENSPTPAADDSEVEDDDQ